MHKLNLVRQEPVDAVLDDSVRLSAADFHQDPGFGSDASDLIDYFSCQSFVAVFVQKFHTTFFVILSGVERTETESKNPVVDPVIANCSAVRRNPSTPKAFGARDDEQALPGRFQRDRRPERRARRAVSFPREADTCERLLLHQSCSAQNRHGQERNRRSWLRVCIRGKPVSRCRRNLPCPFESHWDASRLQPTYRELLGT